MAMTSSERAELWRQRNPGVEAARLKTKRHALGPKSVNETNRRWQEANPGKLREYRLRYARKHPEKVRAHALRNRESGYARAIRYGLTVDGLKELYRKHESRCANQACRMSEEEHRVKFKGPLHIDHDHVTGRVRWLLCKRCNTTLGQVQDNPDLLRGLADLLSVHQKEK
jgi:hypothetical protein